MYVYILYMLVYMYHMYNHVHAHIRSLLVHVHIRVRYVKLYFSSIARDSIPNNASVEFNIHVDLLIHTCITFLSNI